MAIDTREKRMSMLNFGDGNHIHTTFEADGTVDLDDRQHLLDCYSGIAFTNNDTEAPIVLSVTPLDGAQNVAVDSLVTGTFNEDLSAATVTTLTFTLEENGGPALAASVAYDGGSFKATLTPDSDLSEGVLHRARLKVGITDLAGNNLASEFEWSFTVIDSFKHRPADWSDLFIITDIAQKDAAKKKS